MNFKQIIIKGYEELKTQETPYLSYFIREAQLAHRNDFIEFIDFFNGCKVALSYYKKDIEYKYNKRLTENNWALHSYNQKLSNGESIDENGKLVQDQIDYIENDKEFVKEKGYKTNFDYRCFITESGDITESFFETKFELYFSDFKTIEKAILQTEKELLQNPIDITKNMNISKKQELNTDIVARIYDFCVDTKVLLKETYSNVDFINAVNNANFKNLYEHSEQQKSKTKLKYIIYILSKYIKVDDWYLNTAHSINTEPSKCSGINVPNDWKIKADAIK